MTTEINQRRTDSTATLDVDPVEVGKNATTSGDGAVAVGVNTSALADGAIALGDDTSLNVVDAASVGDRDIFLTDGRSLVFPEDQGSQTVADIPISGDSPAGTEHSILFTIAGTEALEIFAEADGSGGVQNLNLNLPGGIDADGDIDVADIIGEAIEISDGGGNTFFAVDANAADTAIKLSGNDIDGLNQINPTNSELKVDGDLTISGELTENSAL
jgi:hypothetical protein